MTVQKDEQISKRVEFKAADDERQIATGVVMVPNKVDLQGDFERPETIREFAEDYMARLPQGEAAQGVMHAVWPEDHITLVENNVLDQAREIGGKEYPAGTWTQSFKFEDNELWTLVRDDILSGYSIGAEDVRWSEPMSQDELPDDVDVAADYPEDEPVWELQEGTIVENSAVDIPAVPDAEILATKDAADAEKRVADLIGNKERFLEEMAERGHSEGEAERLWNYLRRAVDEQDVDVEEGASASILQRVGKAAVNALGGGPSKATDDGTPSPEAAKEGRTLSRANRDALFASIDSQLDVLNDAGVEHGMTRFTDRDDVDFDLADHAGRSWNGEGEEDDSKSASTDKDAPGGETPDRNKQMTNDPFDDAPEWAKELHEEQQKNSDRIDDLADKGDDPEAPEKAWEDAPEWAKQLREEQKQNREQINDLAEASGKSQQLEGGDGDSTESKTSKADVLGLPGGNA